MAEEFARFILTKDIRFKHAKGMRDIFGKELHTYHEIFFFISGDAEVVSEYGTRKLSPFTTVVIPKDTFHSFVVYGDEADYSRCVLNFESVSELDEIISTKLKNFFITTDENIKELFIKMQGIEDSALSRIEREILLKALFAEILIALNEYEPLSFDSLTSKFTKQIVEYIDQNIQKPLSTKNLADVLYISESYLAHIFKKELRISIHKYILEKRLILANSKIKNGTPAMKAAIECGFRDYSGFYKQYKKMFGLSPSSKVSFCPTDSMYCIPNS